MLSDEVKRWCGMGKDDHIGVGRDDVRCVVEREVEPVGGRGNNRMREELGSVAVCFGGGNAREVEWDEVVRCRTVGWAALAISC